MIYTCINYPVPGLVHSLCLRRFSSVFESSVVVLKSFVLFSFGLGMFDNIFYHMTSRLGVK